jgi:hypothetical protein
MATESHPDPIDAVPLSDGEVIGFRLAADKRPILTEPPPVQLVAVADVVLPMPPGTESALDEFYIGLLRFERDDVDPPRARLSEPVLGDDVPKIPPARQKPPLPELPPGALQGPVYRAEKHRISLHVIEPPITRDSLRAVQVLVPSLPAVRHWLDEHEVEYTLQRGVVPGQQSILTQDPAGNWIEIMELRPV